MRKVGIYVIANKIYRAAMNKPYLETPNTNNKYNSWYHVAERAERIEQEDSCSPCKAKTQAYAKSGINDYVF